MKSDWNKWVPIVILGALTLSPAFSALGNEEKKNLDDELRVTDLKIRNFELRKEVKSLKTEKAKLQIKLSELNENLADYEKRLAVIASVGKNTEKINGAMLKELIDDRESVKRLIHKQSELQEFSRKALTALNAEQTLMDEYDRKEILVLQELNKVKATLLDPQQGNGLVLSINVELGAVAVNLGYAQGLIQGSEWNVKDGDRKVATIKILEVRRSISLALVTEGSIGDIPIGSKLEKK